MPFEFKGTAPNAELKKQYAEHGVISEVEGSNYFTGDNVQLAIREGLLPASPLQLAVVYSSIPSDGRVLKPEIIDAVWQPGVPVAPTQGFADLLRATLAEEPNINGEVVRQLPVRTWNEINNGRTRVVLSEELDTESTVAAPPKPLADMSCYDGRFSNVSMS